MSEVAAAPRHSKKTPILIAGFISVLVAILIVLAIRPDHQERARRYYYAAFNELNAKQYEQSVADFKNGLSLDPDNAQAHLYLGDAYKGLGYDSAARSAWKFAHDQGSPAISKLAEARLPGTGASTVGPNSNKSPGATTPAPPEVATKSNQTTPPSTLVGRWWDMQRKSYRCQAKWRTAAYEWKGNGTSSFAVSMVVSQRNLFSRMIGM